MHTNPSPNGKSCRICEKELSIFLPFGPVPISNFFIPKEQLEDPGFKEFKFDLEAAFCPSCKMVQITEFVPYEKYIVRGEDGKTDYLFYSSTSQYMQKHFAAFAADIERRVLVKNDLVVEIGSNDGIMLRGFDQTKVRVLGVEPADNVAEVARSKGIESKVAFFTEALAREIVAEKGKAKAILSANVILNIGDLHELMRGVDLLLADDGIFVFEDPYMPNILRNTAFDQFYDEHIYYFCLTSLSHLLAMYDMEIFDAAEQPTHGGSMRVFAKRKSNPAPVTDRVSKYLEQERELGLHDLAVYEDFADRVMKRKNELVQLLSQLKGEGKRVVGYAATAKSSTMLSLCQIGPETLDYISDNTPDKQGRYSPGQHIPVVSPEHFHADQPDYALLLAWNHAAEILEKEKDFREKGGKFIRYIPELEVI